jgi:hypothetical protein
MYRVTITFVDGHTFQRLVYADDWESAGFSVSRKFRACDLVDINVDDVCLQTHQIRDRVMAAIDSQRTGALS